MILFFIYRWYHHSILVALVLIVVASVFQRRIQSMLFLNYSIVAPLFYLVLFMHMSWPCIDTLQLYNCGFLDQPASTVTFHKLLLVCIHQVEWMMQV